MNPYVGRGKPVSGERLVGRQRMVKRVRDRLLSGTSASVVGIPRVGKTSLVRQVLTDEGLSAQGIWPVYLTLDAIREPAQVFARIVSELELLVPPADYEAIFGQGQIPAEHTEAYHAFRRILIRLRARNRRVAVVLDEFDAVRDFAEGQVFVARVRELASDDRYGISFVFVSRRSLDSLQGRVDCSTLAGICEVIYLGPLSGEGSAAILARADGAVRIHDDAQATLWELAGGHPYLTEVLLCEAVDLIETVEDEARRVLDSDVLNAAVSMQTTEFTSQYRLLRDLLKQDHLYDALVQVLVGPQWQTIDPHVLGLIRSYGLVRVGEAGGDQRAWSDHFGSYLRLMDRTTPLWAILGELETELRGLVADQCSTAYGPAWIAKIAERSRAVSDIVVRLESQRVRERGQFGEAASESLLDYTYIGDLEVIIFAEWNLFRGCLKGEKSLWSNWFKAVIKVRNPTAHHRTVPQSDIDLATGTAKKILDTIRNVSD